MAETSLLRIGVHFEGLARDDGLRIERFLARRTHATVRGRPTLRDLLFGGRDDERRRSQRVAVIDDVDLSVHLEHQAGPSTDPLPLALQACLVAVDGVASGRAVKLCSISHSGCAYLEEEASAPTPGALLTLELSGAELALQVAGRVVYAFKAA
jgi:hypothetical protein